jgi:hypothetical protein
LTVLAILSVGFFALRFFRSGLNESIPMANLVASVKSQRIEELLGIQADDRLETPGLDPKLRLVGRKRLTYSSGGERR